MRIVVLALATGVAAFLLVAVFLFQRADPPPELPLLTYLSGALLASGCGMSLFVPKLLENAGLQRLALGSGASAAANAALGRRSTADADAAGIVRQLCEVYQARTIVAAALCEGAAFLATFARLSEGTLLSLLFAVAGLGLVIAQFPREQAVHAWLEDRLEQLARGG